MGRLLHRASAWLSILLLWAIATPLRAGPVAYEPMGLGWTAEEVQHLAALEGEALVERARREGQLGCQSECDRLSRVFSSIVSQARQQTARSATLPWSLTIVTLPDVDAEVISGGRVVISETFAGQRLASDEALAFVLAHEMAHDILEHERQSLSFARMLLPKEPARSVRDMYVEMDFNMSLRRAMAPVLQQGEFEADELGFLMASAAGYSPDLQLAFLEQECRADAGHANPLVATHPAACARLSALQALLPLARRQ